MEHCTWVSPRSKDKWTGWVAAHAVSLIILQLEQYSDAHRWFPKAETAFQSQSKRYPVSHFLTACGSLPQEWQCPTNNVLPDRTQLWFSSCTNPNASYKKQIPVDRLVLYHTETLQHPQPVKELQQHHSCLRSHCRRWKIPTVVSNRKH